MEKVSNALPRRLLIASVVFGLFVLFDIALFGWLIFRSFSQREIERVLLETREEAETLAGQLARRAEEQGNLYTAMAVEHETQTYIDSILSEREIVRDLVIRDNDGMLVFQMHSRATPPVTPGGAQIPPADSPELPVDGPEVPGVQIREKKFESSFEVPDIEVPIGQYGKLQIGISPVELSERIEVLRRDLVREASLIAIFTILLLLTAYAAVWLLVQRSRRLEVQAVEAERLAYIGTLASGLAHEIRNPLNSLNLNMQMLEEEMEEGAAGSMVPGGSGKRLLAITRSEISRMERLVSDFLAYAKPRPLEMEEMPAVRPLERVRELLAGEIQKRGARVEVEDRSGGARVRVDPGQMSQLLLNLAQNALAATEGTGRSPVLELTVTRHGPVVALSVRDNGAGIPPEERERVFEIFYSTRKGGTGLGLAIVERIARAHGGRVRVESAVGEGTTVTVTLPVAHSPETSPRTAVEHPA
ncbi:MAG TPA: ATP-binding protein [Thermoanaerobaculia bacterium]|nr:ATP-binding protein [Thermoanaerobaculia bacterium]